MTALSKTVGEIAKTQADMMKKMDSILAAVKTGKKSK